MRAVVLVVCLFPLVAHAKPKTITVQAGNGDLILTFDAKKVSEAELRAAAALAPEANPDAMVTESLETCRDDSGASQPCGGARSPTQPRFFKDAEHTRIANVAIVKAASERKVSKEMEPAKEWLRQSAAFYAALEDRKLAYYRSWKSTDLTPPIEGIDGGKECAAIVAKVDAATTKDNKYNLVKFDWHNCMNDRRHAVAGPYPTAPWKAFLKAKGVKAKFVLPDGD